MDELINKVHCLEFSDMCARLPDKSIDCVIIDPPYGLGIDDWDKPIDISHFINEANRIMSDDSFIAVFGIMPYVFEWLKHLEETFVYKEHIVWAKRVHGNGVGLKRMHESIYVYRKGKPKFHELQGFYTDVKLPMLLTDTLSIEAIDRYIKDLWRKAKGLSVSVVGSKESDMPSHKWRRVMESDRSPEKVNFCNVWSFLTENRSNPNNPIHHPTVKPVLLLERLILVLTTPDAIVLDVFSGSGTTALASVKTGRNFICSDFTREYVDIANQRLERADPYKPTRVSDTEIQLSLLGLLGE